MRDWGDQLLLCPVWSVCILREEGGSEPGPEPGEEDQSEPAISDYQCGPGPAQRARATAASRHIPTHTRQELKYNLTSN